MKTARSILGVVVLLVLVGFGVHQLGRDITTERVSDSNETAIPDFVGVERGDFVILNNDQVVIIVNNHGSGQRIMLNGCGAILGAGGEREISAQELAREAVTVVKYDSLGYKWAAVKFAEQFRNRNTTTKPISPPTPNP